MEYNQKLHDEMRDLAQSITFDIKAGLVDTATLTEAKDLVALLEQQSK